MKEASRAALDKEALQKAARDALGYYRLPGGWATGGFRSLLIGAWGHADNENSAKLAGAFPELGLVVSLLRNGNTDAVQAIASGNMPATFQVAAVPAVTEP